MTAVKILHKSCVCGHDHTTHRGERVTLCLDRLCDEEIPRCQNCGEEASGASTREFDACSTPCLLQLEYATRIAA